MHHADVNNVENGYFPQSRQISKNMKKMEGTHRFLNFQRLLGKYLYVEIPCG